MSDLRLWQVAYACDPDGAFIGSLVVAATERQALELGRGWLDAPGEEVDVPDDGISVAQIEAPAGHALGGARVLSCLADAALCDAAGWTKDDEEVACV